MLQETFLTNDLIAKVQKEWDGDILLNCGTQHSRGTALLLKNKHSILNIHNSEDSRIQLINVKIEDQLITIMNIYAPNNSNDRKTFFSKVQKWIDRFAHDESHLIIGGDFNFTENELDRHNKTNTKDVSSVTYKNLIETKNLNDVWRQMHPNRKQFTYKDISRLDKFLVSTDLLDNVQKTNIIIPGVKSDHKCVTLFMDFDTSTRGPGRWKLNTSILTDKTYNDNIKSLLTKTQDEYKNISKQFVWEICKIKIKEFTISYCKYKQKVRKNVIKELEDRVQAKEQEVINSNYNRNKQAERDELINDLHNLVNESNKGAQIRSRAKWVEEGEKSTKFFFNLEKQNISKNTIRKLKKEDGSLTHSDADIMDEGYKFYENLYKNDNITDQEIKTYLQNASHPKTLSDDESNSLEGKIAMQECELALQAMKSNKSPGSDGIPAEFYQNFWTELNPILIESLNNAYELGELSPTQKRSILSLIFKKNDKQLLKNWRPISLLNTDYKILAHVLANRLKTVIKQIIHTDQNGYIKGRNIAYNIRLIQDVINHFEQDNIEGAVVFLDFQKAFDTVNHTFLHATLEKFNFGNSFIKWVKTIYNNAEACLSNNGWTSKPFKIQRGIRQGCPLSALLFLLVVEILGNQIRKNTNDGLEIKVKEEKRYIQVAQLADDTTVFLKNEQAVKNCLHVIKEFGKVTGLKLNMEKTEGLWLGRGKNRGDNFADINWKNEVVKALGVHFGFNKKEIEEKNWRSKVENVKKILNKWKYRDLSMQGRILIVKTLALSQIVYLVSSICIPKWAINEINKELYSFVWKYTRDKICRKVLINDLNKGGMKMLDLKSFCTAAKAVWCQRLYKSKNETWTILPKTYMDQSVLNLLMCMNVEKETHLPLKLPQFYKEAILSWHSCGGGSKAPQSVAEIRKQLLWGNKFIQTKNKTLFYKNWHKSNINFIDDLLDETGNLKSSKDIFNKMQGCNRANWLIEYATILKSIPQAWKNSLKNVDMKLKVKKGMHKHIFDLPVKIKDYYTILTNKIKEKSYIEKYWNDVIPNKPTWCEIWKLRIQTQVDKKLSEFHYKLIHKILPSQENLHKWKLSDSQYCRFGCHSVENYNHMFLLCPRLKPLILKLNQIFEKIGFTLKLTYKTLLFGHKIAYPAYGPLNNLLSYIFHAIYKHWLHNNKQVDIEPWLHSHLIMRQKIYKEQNNTKNFSLLEKFLNEWHIT